MLKYSWPLFATNLLQMLHGIVDSIWVGHFLGREALASVTVGLPILFAVVGIAIGFAIAITILIAQYYGARQQDQVEQVIKNSFFLMVIIGAVLSGIGIYFSHWMLLKIKTPPELLPNAALFLKIFFTGIPFFFGLGVINAILMGLGDSKTPVRFQVIAVVANIILAPFLIIGLGPFPRLGVAGSALASVIAQFFAFVLAVRYLNKGHHFLRFKRHNFVFNKEITWQTFKIALPSSAQQIFVSLAIVVLQTLVNGFGAVVIAAYGVASRALDNLVFLPSMTLASSVSAFTGQNLGAGRQDRVREVVRWASWIGLAISGFISLVVLIFPQALMAIFTGDHQVIAAGVAYLRIVALGYIPFTLMFIIQGVLRGAGDTWTALCLTLFSLWLVRLPLANWLSGFPGLREHGIWLAVLLSSVLGVIVTRAYYATGWWKRWVIVGIEGTRH